MSTLKMGVDSFHINVEQGDSAIHLLVEYKENKPEVRTIKKAVMVDAGPGGGFATNISDTLMEIAKSNGIIKWKQGKSKNTSLKLDAIIITHWDDDHYAGLETLLTKDLEKKVTKKTWKKDTWQPDFLKYGGKNRSEPLTTVYAPYWDMVGGSGAKHKKGHSAQFQQRLEDNIKYLDFVPNITNPNVQTLDKIALLKYEGIVGMEFFNGTTPNKNASKITSITELLQAHSKPSIGVPGMYCIASNQHIIGSAPPPVQSEDSSGDASPPTLGRQMRNPGAPDISNRGDGRGDNRASIACIILWGDTQLSHYFAGDLDDPRELLLVNWIKANGKPGPGKCVTTMKAGHHGSANSTPPQMLKAFAPENIIFSAGTQYGHPRYEVLAYLDLFYTVRRLTKPKTDYRDFKTPVYTTVYPYWFAKSGGKDSKFLKPASTNPTAFLPKSANKPYQQNLRALYKDYTEATNDKLKGGFILDEFKNEVGSQNEDEQSQFIARKVAAKWESLSKIEPSAYPGDATPGVYYGASQSPVQNSIRYILVENRQPLLNDGTVRLRECNTAKLAELRNNSPRVKSALLRTSEGGVNVPPWAGRIFGDTVVTAPTSQLSGSLPNDISVVTSAQRYLSNDQDPDEVDSDPDSDDDLAQEFELPPRLVLNAVTAEPGFYYCSSRIATESGPNVGVCNLPLGSPLDDFTSALHSGVVALVQVPNLDQSQNFLDDDEWHIWWKAALKSNSLFAFGDQSEITSFGTSIQFGSFNLTFDNPSVALNFPPPSDPMFESLVVDTNITILGLNPVSNGGQSMDFDLSDIYSAFGIAGSPIISLKATLSPTAQGMRNAIWFRPELNYMTTLRLAFTIDESDLSSLNVLFQPFNLKVISGVVIGVKTCNWLWDGINSASASLAYCLTFQSDSFTDLVLGALVFESDSTQIIINCNNKWSDWLAWLLGVLHLDGKPGSNFPSWFGSICDPEIIPEPRRIQFSLDANNDIQSCQFDFGVSLAVGKDESLSNAPTPVVVLSFFWSRSSGVELRGTLWTGQPYPTLDNHYLPGYETYNDLSLSTQDPAPSLSLASLFPRVQLTGIPKSIIPQILAATFSITESEISFFGQLETNPTSNQGGVPPMPLALLSLTATYTTSSSNLSIKASDSSVFTLELDVNVQLQGKPGSQSTPALLTGSLSYATDADPPWRVEAGVQDLSVGTLYQFFDSDSRDGAMALLGELSIVSLKLDYLFGSEKSTSAFTFTGTLQLGIFELDLIYSYPPSQKWDFTATLTVPPQDLTGITVQSLITEISNDIVLPNFVGQIPLSSITLNLHAGKVMVAKQDFVFFLTELKVGDFEILYLQYHTAEWSTPKRIFRAAVTGLPNLDDVPIVSELVQPFDELYFLYVSIDPSQKIQGISIAELDEIQNFVAAQGSNSPILSKTSYADPQPTDVAITPGLHFVVVVNQDNKPTAVLDYAFGSTETSANFTEAERLTQATDPADGPASVGSVKKSFGPLTISNIGLQYKSGVLGVLLDATFKLGPIQLDLIAFTLGVNLSGSSSLMSFPKPSVDLKGVGVSFNQPPTSLAGLFEKLGDLYAGGIEVSFDPYTFLAGGCYGTITDSAGDFKTVAIFGKLEGPLVELEFAEISGICGGFGYNSLLKLPTVDQVTNFPLVGDNTSPDKNASPLSIFENFAPGWVTPTRDDFWFAAGLKVTALQTLNVNAVVVVEYAESIKLGIFADCVASFPPDPSQPQFVYVELGISAVADFGTGTMIIEGKLAPTSFVFDPACHLSGGFALCYWFDPSGNAGDWVFTVGGYHPAYIPQPNYPRPDRLAISWNLDSISIVGQSYFAITPKACMGGGSLQASLSLGPLYAYFDAWADFLMNYHPFYFVGDIGVTVGVQFTLDLWICTIHISIEIGASLHIEGPTVHGTVHVDFWVFGFDIDFGDDSPRPDPLLLLDFYRLILQQNDTTKTSAHIMASVPTISGAHTIACESGIVPPNSGGVVVPSGLPWNVRGSGFVCSVTSPFPFTSAEVTAGGGVQDIIHNIYSRPMQTPKDQELTSTVTISVKDTFGSAPTTIAGFEVKEISRNLPSSIWAPYSEDDDPLISGNQITSLLSGDSPTIPLMTGVQLIAPAPQFAPDEIPPFDIKVAGTSTIGPYSQGLLAEADKKWLTAPSVKGEQQWIDVQNTWLSPSEGDLAAQDVADAWVRALGWKGADVTDVKLSAAAPKLLLGNKKIFETYYLSAPMISVG